MQNEEIFSFLCISFMQLARCSFQSHYNTNRAIALDHQQNYIYYNTFVATLLTTATTPRCSSSVLAKLVVNEKLKHGDHLSSIAKMIESDIHAFNLL